MIRKEKLEELKSIIEELKMVEAKKTKAKTKPFLQIEKYKFKLNNGRMLIREKLVKGKTDGSAAIILPVVDDEILTIIEPRVFTELTVGVGFPAGYIEKGEDGFTAALREFMEETGYTTDNIIELDSFYQDEGCSSALNHIFLALNCKKTGEQSLDKDEIIKYMLFKYEELLELEQLGFIKGGNSKLALEKSKIYLKGRYYGKI